MARGKVDDESLAEARLLIGLQLRGTTGDGLSQSETPAEPDKGPSVEHPVLWKHPECGDRVLLVDESHAVRISGSDPSENERLLFSDFPLHFKREEYRWTHVVSRVLCNLR